MKVQLKVFLLIISVISSLTFLTTSSLFASSPTTWILKNQSSQIIEVQCKGTTSEPKINPKLLPLLVPAHQTRKHLWGSNWHNDGMGLNPARWECEAKALDQSQSPAKLAFETKWGESIELSISLETKELRLSKVTKEDSQVQ